MQFPTRLPLLVKWRETPALQFWKERYRGDLCPPIVLKDRRQEMHHCDDMSGIFNEVKDDYVQMLELAVEFHHQKSGIVNRHLKKAMRTSDGAIADAREASYTNFQRELDA